MSDAPLTSNERFVREQFPLLSALSSHNGNELQNEAMALISMAANLRRELAELETSLAIYKGRDEGKQLVINQLERHRDLLESNLKSFVAHAARGSEPPTSPASNDLLSRLRARYGSRDHQFLTWASLLDEAADEIERLHEELRSRETEHCRHGRPIGHCDTCEEDAERAAEPPEDRRDAERYRWLRVSRLLPHILAHELDTAIDAARAAETKNEYRVPSSTPAGETAAAAGAESTADPSIDDEQHTDSLIEKLESVVAGETSPARIERPDDCRCTSGALQPEDTCPHHGHL